MSSGRAKRIEKSGKIRRNNPGQEPNTDVRRNTRKNKKRKIGGQKRGEGGTK